LITLNEQHLTEMRQHGERDYPFECCGLMLGRFENNSQKVVLEAYPISNAREEAAKRNRFLIRPDELLRSIRLPRATSGWRQYYRKVGTRRAQAISKVCFAAAATLDRGRIRDVRIALGSVAPTVLRCAKTEGTLRVQPLAPRVIDAARESLASEIAPIDDLRSTAAYRLRVAQNLLDEFLQTLR